MVTWDSEEVTPIYPSNYGIWDADLLTSSQHWVFSDVNNRMNSDKMAVLEINTDSFSFCSHGSSLFESQSLPPSDHGSPGRINKRL